MADEKMVSERDVVLRERVAFVRGAQYSYRRDDNPEAIAAGYFKLPPKVTRPRVIRDGLWEFRACGDVIEARAVDDGEWGPIDDDMHDSLCIALTRHRVGIWNGLLARPIEEVDQ